MPFYDALTPQELMMLSPLQLAYIGDSVYDLMVRSSLLKNNWKLHAMHLGTTQRVNATAQALTLQRILPYLSEDEADYVRRGRNAHAKHGAPKNSSPADYAAATGFETLFGYLYVQGKEERLKELFEMSCEFTDD